MRAEHGPFGYRSAIREARERRDLCPFLDAVQLRPLELLFQGADLLLQRSDLRLEHWCGRSSASLLGAEARAWGGAGRGGAGRGRLRGSTSDSRSERRLPSFALGSPAAIWSVVHETHQLRQAFNCPKLRVLVSDQLPELASPLYDMMCSTWSRSPSAESMLQNDSARMLAESGACITNVLVSALSDEDSFPYRLSTPRNSFRHEALATGMDAMAPAADAAGGRRRQEPDCLLYGLGAMHGFRASCRRHRGARINTKSA